MNERTQEKFLQEAVEILEELKLSQYVSDFLNTEYVKAVIQEEVQHLKKQIEHAVETAPDSLKDTAEELAKSIVDYPTTFENSLIATFKVNLAKDFYSFLRYVSIDRSILLEAFNPSNKKLPSQFKYMAEELRKTVFKDYIKGLTTCFLADNMPFNPLNLLNELLGDDAEDND